jgi:hypothetical protein
MSRAEFFTMLNQINTGSRIWVLEGQKNQKQSWMTWLQLKK